MPTRRSSSPAQKKIDYLAEEIMGWRRGKADEDGFLFEDEDAWYEEGESDPSYARNCDRRNGMTRWDPSSDGNHWRQVERKVMQDDMLWAQFSLHFDCSNTLLVRKEHIMAAWILYMKADLPARVDAVISAHRSLRS